MYVEETAAAWTWRMRVQWRQTETLTHVISDLDIMHAHRSHVWQRAKMKKGRDSGVIRRDRVFADGGRAQEKHVIVESKDQISFA